MGQQQSKQNLDQITESLNRIRKDVRSGKITANDVERIRGILQRYSTEIEGSRHVRASKVYTIEQLIEITSQELDALKQEVNLDSAAVKTNSFFRSSSRKSSKDKSKSVKAINDAVHDIRIQIRTGNVKQEDYERLQGELVNYSQELSAKKNKKSDVDACQKLISSVTQELLLKQQEVASEVGSIRRSTTPTQKKVDRSSLSEKRSSWSEKRASKEVEPKKEHKIANKNNTSTLDDIQNKLDALKSEIKVADTNKDKSRLHFLAKSIQTLMTDLQMVNVKNQILNEERKTLLEKNLQRAYQQIEKIKRQITEESDLNYLKELHQKEAKEKCLQELDEIQKSFSNISLSLTVKNFQTAKDNFITLKAKLDGIEANDEDIKKKKQEIDGVVANVEKDFTRVEMEERVNQAEWRHCQYKIDLKTFKGTSESEVYRKHKQYLEQLRDYVNKVLDVNTKLEEKKKYVLYNIENNIIALDLKAKQNAGLDESNEEVILRKPSKTSSKSQIEDLVKSIKEISVSSQNQNVLPRLNEAKAYIEQKINLLQGMDRTDSPDVLLVTVREKTTPPPSSPTPPPKVQFDNLQKEVERIHVQIENSRYTKETQLYKDLRSKLEGYKVQTQSLCGNENGSKSAETLLKYIDNVLLLLDNNSANRKSTTEDILVDIMSVSTRVNDLGSKLQNVGKTSQDYSTIRSGLLENKDYLRKLQIAPNRTNISKSRDDILDQIDRYLGNLETDKKNGSTSGTEEEKKFNQDLRKLKEKVSRYSGTYKNVLYKAIESDLDKHLNKVDKVFKDSSLALKVKQEIQNTKMILEQKSTKEQECNTKHDGSKELTEIKEHVQSVRNTLNRNVPLSREDLDKLDARLTLSILALDNIRDDYPSDEKEGLYQEIDLYFQKIHELMLLTRSDSVQEDDPHLMINEQQVMAVTLKKIEEELETVKPQILTFVGTETNPNFLLLDEVLVKGTLKLDELTLDQTSELYQSKAKLMREIHKLSDILDERIQQTEELEKLEKEVKVMLMKIDSFNGYFGDSEYTYLDEEIIRLKVSLGKLQVNQELVSRKETCIKEVDNCMRKLNEAAKSRTDKFAGTLV